MGLEMNALLLLPTGGLTTFANGAELTPEMERADGAGGTGGKPGRRRWCWRV